MDNRELFSGSGSAPTRWLVKDYIPLGGYYLVVAQPGVGKSYLLESLAVDVFLGERFLGMDTLAGDVLLIDEDSNPAVAKSRLNSFYKRYDHSEEPEHHLFAFLGEGYRIANGDTNSLYSLVTREEHKDVRLIIIDTLQGVVGGKSNLDNTRDASAITEFAQSISSQDRTVLLVHHVSAKSNLSVNEAMSCDNPDRLAMNSTRLVSSSEGMYVLASPTKGSALKELYVRPVTRRVLLPRPFKVSFSESGGVSSFSMAGDIFKGESGDLIKSEKYVLSEFTSENGLALTVKDLSIKMAGLMHDNTLRSCLGSLEEKGYIAMVAREGKGGKHFHSLTEKGTDWVVRSGVKPRRVRICPSSFSDSDKQIPRGQGVKSPCGGR